MSAATLTADRVEGAVRLVTYQRNPANPGAPLRAFQAATAKDVAGLRKSVLLRGVLRVDVERVEVGHWSLVAQQHPGRGKDRFIDLGYTNQGKG